MVKTQWVLLRLLSVKESLKLDSGIKFLKRKLDELKVILDLSIRWVVFISRLIVCLNTSCHSFNQDCCPPRRYKLCIRWWRWLRSCSSFRWLVLSGKTLWRFGDHGLRFCCVSMYFVLEWMFSINYIADRVLRNVLFGLDNHSMAKETMATMSSYSDYLSYGIQMTCLLLSLRSCSILFAKQIPSFSSSTSFSNGNFSSRISNLTN